jgi:hypothetical protein
MVKIKRAETYGKKKANKKEQLRRYQGFVKALLRLY